MAVIVRERVKFGDSYVETKSYLPPGFVSKRDRLRADRLEATLAEEMPAIERKLSRQAPRKGNLVFRWYSLGRYLRKIIDDPHLVSRVDVDSKLVFLAVWQHLPASLKPAETASTTSYSEKQHKRKDHLSLCYEISAFDWSEVEWIKRWSDWHALANRPGVLRDKRILPELGRAVGNLVSYPSRKAFREIAKNMGDAFPTRRLRDSSLLSDDEIRQVVRQVVHQVSGTQAGT
ncbi:MAG: hypothetical protein WBD05_09895 [Phycisphaerae bacterium]